MYINVFAKQCFVSWILTCFNLETVGWAQKRVLGRKCKVGCYYYCFCCRNADHIHTNYRDLYHYLRKKGYFIEVLGMFHGVIVGKLCSKVKTTALLTYKINSYFLFKGVADEYFMEEFREFEKWCSIISKYSEPLH